MLSASGALRCLLESGEGDRDATTLVLLVVESRPPAGGGVADCIRFNPFNASIKPAVITGTAGEGVLLFCVDGGDCSDGGAGGCC